MNDIVDWNGMEGAQLKLLWNALVSDFTMFELDAALVAHLGRAPLANFAAPVLPYRIQAFQLIGAAKRGGWVRELIDGLIAANPGGPGLRRFRETVGLTAQIKTAAPGGWTIESLLRNDPDFLEPDGWIAKLVALRRSVCRIEHTSRPADKPGFGTGWLVGPDLVLTAHHVVRPFEPSDNGLAPSGVTCRFDVPEPPAASTGRTCTLASDWLVDTGRAKAAEPALDYAVIRIAERAAEDRLGKDEVRGVIRVAATGEVSKAGDNLLIVQHPDGLPQRFSFGNTVKSDAPGVLLHDANTLAGSSGSLVVNIKLEPVGLHRGGGATNHAIAIAAIAARVANHGVALG